MLRALIGHSAHNSVGEPNKPLHLTAYSKEVKDDVESTSDGQVAAKVYAFRRPRFPEVYAVGRALLAATSPAPLQRQLWRLDLQGVGMIDMTVRTARFIRSR